MKLLPKEIALLAELQEEFDQKYKSVLTEAHAIFSERASMRDIATPVWHRVVWPEGYIYELKKRLGRIESVFPMETMEIWPKTREEMLDMINYLGFMVAFGDMLHGAETK